MWPLFFGWVTWIHFPLTVSFNFSLRNEPCFNFDNENFIATIFVFKHNVVREKNNRTVALHFNQFETMDNAVDGVIHFRNIWNAKIMVAIYKGRRSTERTKKKLIDFFSIFHIIMWKSDDRIVCSALFIHMILGFLALMFILELIESNTPANQQYRKFLCEQYDTDGGVDFQ